MKNVRNLLTFTLIMVFLGGCGNGATSQENPSSVDDSQFVDYGVAGHIVEINATDDESVLGSIKVKGSEDNGAMYKEAVVKIIPNTKIYSNNPTDFNNLELDMYVNIFFEGPVKESFPVQATAKQVNLFQMKMEK